LIRAARIVMAAGLVAMGAAGFGLMLLSVVAGNAIARWAK